MCVCVSAFFYYSVETLTDTVKKTLRYCRVMCEGAGLGAELGQGHARTLLKMMVINIFAIHHAAESYSGEQCGDSP